MTAVLRRPERAPGPVRQGITYDTGARVGYLRVVQNRTADLNKSHKVFHTFVELDPPGSFSRSTRLAVTDDCTF